MSAPAHRPRGERRRGARVLAKLSLADARAVREWLDSDDLTPLPTPVLRALVRVARAADYVDEAEARARAEEERGARVEA